jgi:hypothetical protein
MERITIEIDDDGRISVMAESPGEDMESMEFETVDEAASAVRDLLLDAEQDKDGEESPEDEQDMESMWAEEASKRPKNPQMLD